MATLRAPAPPTRHPQDALGGAGPFHRVVPTSSTACGRLREIRGKRIELRQSDNAAWQPLTIDGNTLNMKGLSYNEVDPGLFVGSQPLKREDVRFLAETEGVTHIISMQEEANQRAWRVDPREIAAACSDCGVLLTRIPTRDHSISIHQEGWRYDERIMCTRARVPIVVAALGRALMNGDCVYLHCTAGMGRAPSAAIAFLYWVRNMDLDEAREFVRLLRPGAVPDRDGVRGATFNILDAENANHRWLDPRADPFPRKPRQAWAYLSESDRVRLCERLGILDVWHHYKRLESGSQAYAEGSDAAADADGVLLEAASSPNACLL